MNRKLNLILSGFIMTFLVLSCGTGRYVGNENDVEHTPHCGFSEDVGVVETTIDEPTKKTSPAADRTAKTAEKIELNENTSLSNGEVAENIDFAPERKSRNETKLGNKRKRVKEFVKEIRNFKKEKKRGGDVGMTILLVILAILLPPLAVGIYEGITGRFWLVLVLWLLGIGLLAWLLPGLFYIGGLVAVILALLIVLGVW